MIISKAFAVVAIVAAVLALPACRAQQSIQDGCGEPDCTPCDVDADCRIFGNPCGATATCGHSDADITVILLGCDAAVEYEVPTDSACSCVADACGPR